jgi:hypothetical protein
LFSDLLNSVEFAIVTICLQFLCLGKHLKWRFC